MATEGPLIRDGSQLVAAGDMSTGNSGPGGSSQFTCVKIGSTDRQVVRVTQLGDVIRGVLQNKPTNGIAADIGIFGVSKAVAGAAITVGAKLQTDTQGRVITLTGTSLQIGVAYEAATAANQIITIGLTGQSGG